MCKNNVYVVKERIVANGKASEINYGLGEADFQDFCSSDDMAEFAQWIHEHFRIHSKPISFSNWPYEASIEEPDWEPGDYVGSEMIIKEKLDSSELETLAMELSKLPSWTER
tara:strand:+ start:207 stop:542 length:336 start_codon:yes stop_codon:yes gene_type:complete